MVVDELGLQVPRILLPADDVPLETWAVIACDQHTSDPDYWERVDALVGQHPSSLRAVFPEVYLNAADRAERIATIGRQMAEYADGGVLRELEPGFVLVDRQTAHVPSRRGLLVALDLERYSYEADAKTLIRTTEGTVVSRLAPRIEVRKDASIELPHIMVLIDDPRRTVIEPLFDAELPSLYDTELMLGGGRVRGWHVTGDPVQQALNALRGLLPTDEPEPMLYAMGDGNHSFATAQAVWQQIKQAAGGLDAVADHPARHALVELVNLHDDGLVFEPIHRALFGPDAGGWLDALRAAHPDGSVTVERMDVDAWERACGVASTAQAHRLPWIEGETRGIATVHNPSAALPAATLQDLLSQFEQHNDVEVDYIHGVAETVRLGSQPGTVGILSEVIDKGELFSMIRRMGPLPRKSFSLGEAEEKRYYLEGRRIA